MSTPALMFHPARGSEQRAAADNACKGRREAALIEGERGGRLLVGCHLAAIERRTEETNCVYSSLVRSFCNG